MGWGNTKQRPFLYPHSDLCTLTLNAAVVTVVAPVALCVDAAVDVQCRLLVICRWAAMRMVPTPPFKGRGGWCQQVAPTRHCSTVPQHSLGAEKCTADPVPRKESGAVTSRFNFGGWLGLLVCIASGVQNQALLSAPSSRRPVPRVLHSVCVRILDLICVSVLKVNN